MIERQSGELIVECDSCSEVLETETDDFSEALADMRAQSWTSKKIGGEWLHLCPACQGYDPRQKDMF